MKKLVGFVSMLLLVTVLVAPVFADKAADDKATMDQVMTKVDTGEMTIVQALEQALEQGVSFAAIVEACESRGIALSNLVVATTNSGMSCEIVLAKLSAAGLSQAQLMTAKNDCEGNDGQQGLAYTPANAGRVTAVQPVTSNPGGTAQGGTVSPSSL